MQEYFDRTNVYLAELREQVRNREYGRTISCLEVLEDNFDHLRSEVERAMKLSQVESDLFTSPKSLDETLDHIATIIKKEFEFSRFDIVLIDNELRRVMRRYSKGGFGKTDLDKLSQHGALNATRDYCLTNRDPWIVNDIKGQDPRWRLALELDVWVHGTFPLYQHKIDGTEELVGYLHGARNKKAFLAGKLYSDSDEREIKRLGRAILNAIKEAKLSYFEHGVMKIQDVIGSTRIDKYRIPDDPDIEEETRNQMDTVLDTIIETLAASYGGILLRDKSHVTSMSFRNDKGETISPERIRVSSRPLTGLVSRSLYNGYSVIENEISAARERLDVEILNFDENFHTMIVVPLIEAYSEQGIVRKNVIGVIMLVNKKNEDKRVIKTDYEGNEGGFSSLDLRILESISPHIETIISNTRSHQDLQRLSLFDGLTELANHTHFMNNLLTLEFKRSERYGTPLSMLLMDIDHFKVFNDIFGHQVGDLVLRETARILRDNTRSVDHICRYGGEEFGALLHNTYLMDAYGYAEKIRHKIAETDYTEKMLEMNLFSIVEAKKRFQAIRDIDDKRVRDAKMAIMSSHFGLDILNILKMMNEGKLMDAEEKILKSLKVTISIGLAHYPNPKITSKKDLVTSADMLLLKAKEKGRNRVETSEI